MNDIEDIINYFTGVIEMHGDDNDKKYWNTVLKERQSDKERIKELEKKNKVLNDYRTSVKAGNIVKWNMCEWLLTKIKKKLNLIKKMLKQK